MGGFGGSFGGSSCSSRSCHTTWNAGYTKISNPSKGPDPSWCELGCFSCGQGSRYCRCPKSRNSNPNSKARNTSTHSKARNSNTHSKARNASGKPGGSPQLGFGSGFSGGLGGSWGSCSYDTAGAKANAGSHADAGSHDAGGHTDAGSHDAGSDAGSHTDAGSHNSGSHNSGSHTDSRG